MAACPPTYTASANGGCYFIPPDPAPHWDCSSRCGPGASLACPADDDTLTAVAADFLSTRGIKLWIGVYQGLGAAEPLGGWDKCTNGANLTQSAWLPGEPNHWGIEGEDCVTLVGSEARWTDSPCGLNAHCLCALGAAESPEYAAFADAQRAAWPSVQASLTSWTLIVFLGVVPILSLLPAVLLCLCARARKRCKTAAKNAPPTTTTTTTTTAAPTIPTPEHAEGHNKWQRAMTTLKRSRSSGSLLATLSIAEAHALEKGQRAAAALRNRVSGTIANTGWALVILGLTPFALFIFAIDLTPKAGSWTYYLGALFFGLAMFGLALRPIDARRIATTCRLLFGFCVLFVLVFAWSATGTSIFGSDTVQQIAFICLALLFAGCAGLLVPTLRCRGGCCGSGYAAQTMPPRRQLRRLWTALRLLIFGFGCLLLVFPLGPAIRDSRLSTFLLDPINCGLLVSAAMAFLTAAAFTPSTRGAVHRWLGQLGKSDSKQQEAAAVASILGGHEGGAVAALKEAKRTFRALPVASLTVEALADNNTNHQLSAKTLPAELGEVAAFMSHSWQDAGGAKHEKLKEYAVEHEKKNPGEPVTIWLDKACINQRNIQTSLAVLPVFLSGCRELLILAGKTYTTRLWCVMEVRLLTARDLNRVVSLFLIAAVLTDQRSGLSLSRIALHLPSDGRPALIDGRPAARGGGR